MLRKLLGAILALALVGAFLLTFAFLWWKAQEPPEVFETVSPSHRDLVLKTVATGAIVPRVEVEIKSRVSGVVDALLVEPSEALRAE